MCKFAGWKEVTKKTKSTILGVEKEDVETTFEVDYTARLMNESGANHLFSDLYPLISPLATTSKTDKIEMYKQYRYKLKSLKRHLLNSIFIGIDVWYTDKGEPIKNKLGNPESKKVFNPYQMMYWNIPDAISYLCTLWVISSKSDKGFTLQELAESFTTATIFKTGTQRQESGGIRDRINKLMKHDTNA